MAPPVEHTDVGAYALGILDDAETADFEAHLLQCSVCQAELKSLSSTTNLLDELRASSTTPEESQILPNIIDELTAQRQRRRTRTWLAAAAAAVLIVAGPVITGVVLSTKTENVFPAGSSVFTAQAANGTQLTAGILDKGWGSEVTMELRGVRGPQSCELIAVGKDGREVVVSSWLVPEKGYGVPEQPQPLTLRGGAALAKANIDRLEVRTLTNETLVSVKL